jgi:hypothetical protein
MYPLFYEPCLDGTLEIDPDVRKLLRQLRHAARWSLLPYGWWTDADGSFVIFDGRYRPICRKRPHGSIEIVAPGTWIAYVGQSWLYRGLVHPDNNAAARDRVLGVVQRLDLADEIARRREHVRETRTPLPRWNLVAGRA